MLIIICFNFYKIRSKAIIKFKGVKHYVMKWNKLTHSLNALNGIVFNFFIFSVKISFLWPQIRKERIKKCSY